MSEKQWKDEKNNLINSLGSRLKEVDMDYYATVGYNSPWSQDRRNEVWLVKQKDSVYDAKHSKKASSGSPSEISEKEDLETVPYEVLESKQVSEKITIISPMYSDLSRNNILLCLFYQSLYTFLEL